MLGTMNYHFLGNFFVCKLAIKRSRGGKQNKKINKTLKDF
jgi:hypothetical protein